MIVNYPQASLLKPVYFFVIDAIMKDPYKRVVAELQIGKSTYQDPPFR